MKVDKFYVGWVTGFITAVVPVAMGFDDAKLEELGWWLIPIAIATIAFYLGMKFVAKWALGEDTRDH